MRAAVPRRGMGASVRADWIGWLPDAKMQAFRVYADDFESRYLMLSISLNEAIGLRDSGAQSKSYQVVVITPDLCERLTGRLEGMLWSLEEHVTRYGLVPSVAPLRAADFHGLRGQRSARKSCLLCTVLLSQRSQYLSKVGTLREMIGCIGGDFCNAAAELTTPGGSANPALLWAAMDTGHFDLNSCLRESMILLKCFMRVLPNPQLQEFQKAVSLHTTALNSELPLLRRLRSETARRILSFQRHERPSAGLGEQKPASCNKCRARFSSGRLRRSIENKIFLSS